MRILIYNKSLRRSPNLQIERHLLLSNSAVARNMGPRLIARAQVPQKKETETMD